MQPTQQTYTNQLLTNENIVVSIFIHITGPTHRVARIAPHIATTGKPCGTVHRGQRFKVKFHSITATATATATVTTIASVIIGYSKEHPTITAEQYISSTRIVIVGSKRADDNIVESIFVQIACNKRYKEI